LKAQKVHTHEETEPLPPLPLSRAHSFHGHRASTLLTGFPNSCFSVGGQSDMDAS
jgi:hypothetical protein